MQQSLLRFYDGWNMIAKIDITSSAQLLRSYEWGVGVSGTMTCYYGNGNITELVNLFSGSISARYEYGAFGETICMDGGAVTEANPFRLSTKYLDVETGLNNYGHRYYDAVNGRWLNRGPIAEEGGRNLYGRLGMIQCISGIISNLWESGGGDSSFVR